MRRPRQRLPPALRHANGNTVDREGRLVTCEHGGRRVSRTEHDGRITAIADRYQGKRLNSPNDVVMKSDGSIWFTNPPYGILSDYEGDKAESELGKNHVFRVDPLRARSPVVADDFERPNGLAFSPDETAPLRRRLGAPLSNLHMRVFDVPRRQAPQRPRVCGPAPPGASTASGSTRPAASGPPTDEGVHCYDPDGTLIGKIRCRKSSPTSCFGGPGATACSSPATTSLYAVLLPSTAPRPFETCRVGMARYCAPLPASNGRFRSVRAKAPCRRRFARAIHHACRTPPACRRRGRRCGRS